MIRVVAILLTMMMAVPGVAQTSKLRTLDTENSASVWKAVGRINFGRGSFCSGTLIAPDLVLTAAHCLYPEGRDTVWPAKDITFHAGYRNGTSVTSRKVRMAEAHSGFKPLSALTDKNVAHDVALLRLDSPISPFDVAPFYLQNERVRTGPVSVVSYGRGRADTQSRQNECQLFEQLSDILLFDCDVTFGSSGAPVFSHLNGRGQIISVISGMATYGDRRISLGMKLPQRVDEVKRQMRIKPAKPTASIRRIGVGGNKNGTGAKFVRP